MTEGQVWDLVTQTLDRLEGKVDTGLAGLNAKLDTKADKADLSRLYGRLEGTERRVDKVERAEAEDALAAEVTHDHEQARRERTHRRMLLACSVVSTAALVIAVVHV
jgi:hypothetical protein